KFSRVRVKADVMFMNLRWLALVVVSVLLIIAAAVAAFAGVRGSVTGQDQRSARGFQQLVLQVLRERYPDRTFVADKDPDLITSPQDDLQLGLANVRALVEQSRGTDAEKREMIAAFFAQTMAGVEGKGGGIPKTWEAARPLVRPYLLGRDLQSGRNVVLVRKPL